MIHFKYTGRNNIGEIVDGFIDGENKEAATNLLLRDGITPLKLSVTADEQDIFKILLAKINIKIGFPSIKDLILFSMQMHSLSRAGVPIVRAIQVVKDSTQNIELELALANVADSLQSGHGLAMSMGKHPDVFPPLMHALVDVGENTGSLDKIFSQMSSHFERELDTINRVKSALRYPTMVIITIMVAIGAINIFVIPAFASFFAKFGAKLPLPTLCLMAMSNFTIHYWYLLISGIIAIVVSWIKYIKTTAGKMQWDRWKIKLPLIGAIIEKSLLARFARSFALCSRTGVPLLEAITLIAKTTDNVFVGNRIIEIRSNVEHGDSLTNSAKLSGMFTPLVLQMMAIGEETGDLDKLLDEVADFYEREIDYELKKLSEAIEPILITIVATMVLILALGVFLPMWDISKVALSKS